MEITQAALTGKSFCFTGVRLKDPELVKSVAGMRSIVDAQLNLETFDRLSAFFNLVDDASLAPADKLAVAVPRGNGPDLFIFAHDRLGDWATSGLLETKQRRRSSR